MAWHGGVINQIADDVIITTGIVVLVVRQFSWRSAEVRRMLRLPIAIIAVGIGYLAVELLGGFHWVAGDWMLIGELVLVAFTGTAMGYVTRFRTRHDCLEYKLTATGLWLWLVFIGIRIGSFYLAAMLDASLAGATGLILLSFGVNRLAAVLVVRRRAANRLAHTPAVVVENVP